MPLFDDDGWKDYLRSFPDEPEERYSADARLYLDEFLEQIGMHPKDTTCLLMMYLDNDPAERVAGVLRCTTTEAKGRYKRAIEDAQRRALTLINLEYVKDQPFVVRMFLRHLFMW